MVLLRHQLLPERSELDVQLQVRQVEIWGEHLYGPVPLPTQGERAGLVGPSYSVEVQDPSKLRLARVGELHRGLGRPGFLIAGRVRLGHDLRRLSVSGLGGDLFCGACNLSRPGQTYPSWSPGSFKPRYYTRHARPRNSGGERSSSCSTWHPDPSDRCCNRYYPLLHYASTFPRWKEHHDGTVSAKRGRR